ncbi:hypothetical protein GKE82_05980 [Conexibacter sp. W3-3-2]|uniref:hypothetical protein n=1 Tax=Conexibacter sp. W3-3-2 TaxID=2675227 RepID=UPI0012B79275|nr:hypothetical protein [Conexibacter sp. W3-3-2]MTD43865.1 hypothetical protein [Conexibacter sp. W3-3-2]
MLRSVGAAVLAVVLGGLAGYVVRGNDVVTETTTETVARTVTVPPLPVLPTANASFVVCDRQRLACQQDGHAVSPPEVNGAECRAPTEGQTWRWVEVSDFISALTPSLARRLFEYTYICYPRSAG